MKGIIVYEEKTALIALFSITTIFNLFNIFATIYVFDGILQFLLLTYFIVSYLEYSYESFHMPLPVMKKFNQLLFATLSVKTEEVRVKYRVLRLPLTIVINLVVLIVTKKWVNYYKGISFDITTQKGDEIFITL